MMKEQNENNTENIKNEETKATEHKAHEGGVYVFYKTDYDKLPEGRHKIKAVYEMCWEATYHSLFIGQVITLFGKPDYSTEDNEDLISYAVAAEDRNGNVIFLEVYYGPSGPAIGGLEGDDYVLAADELNYIITEAKPTDFEIASTYEDADISLKMGVKDGKPYYDTIWPEGMFDE